MANGILDYPDIDEFIELIAERVFQKLRSESSGEKMIGRNQLSKETGLSLATIDRRLRDGLLPTIRSGRRVMFRLTDVVASLKSTNEKSVDSCR